MKMTHICVVPSLLLVLRLPICNILVIWQPDTLIAELHPCLGQLELCVQQSWVSTTSFSSEHDLMQSSPSW